MDPEEHYETAEALLAQVAEMADSNEDSTRFKAERTYLIALAQVHATLATLRKQSR